MTFSKHIFILLFLAINVIAQEKKEELKVEPILSPDVETLSKIKELPINTWLKLPAFKVTGDKEWLTKSSKSALGPEGRDYSNKMAWMPDRKRAIYAGGGHNNNPYNDVWEYDLASNTWVCLYGADENSQGKSAEWMKANLVIKDGALQTKRGGPPRLTHTFDTWNYDSSRRIAFMSESFRGALFTDKKIVAQGLGLTDEELAKQWKPGSYFLTFDPYACKWGFINENVIGCQEACSVRYIPHLNQWWTSSRQSLNLFDPTEKKTKELPIKGAIGGYECSTTFDTNSKTIVGVHRFGKSNNVTFTYEIDTGIWKTPQTNAPTGGSTSTCYFDFDSVANRCVLFTQEVKPNLWLYDVKANEWTPIEPNGEQPPPGRMIGYYDPERDVVVHYNSKEIWVCRVKVPKK